jgi:hypothetical protein
LKKFNVNVEAKSHKKYEKQPLKTFMSTTIFGYVFYGRKKRFQNYRCRDTCSHNKTSQKGCQMGPKNNQDWRNIYVLSFKTMTIMAIWPFFI